jgi:lysozyme family protein
MYTFEKVAPEYAKNWAQMKILPAHVPEITKLARLADAGKPRYQAVEKSTDVPWPMVAIIHQLECSGRWDQHLANGDSLKARTHNVPKGVLPPPATPPFSWHDAAVYALQHRGLAHVSSWTIERIAFECEAYNGWGYRSHGILTPYLWSFSSLYRRGKYRTDGHYDPDLVSSQVGALVLLQALMKIDSSFQIPVATGDHPVPESMPAAPAVATADIELNPLRDFEQLLKALIGA